MQLTHRGTGRALPRLVIVAAGGLRGAGRSPRRAHQMEHVVLVLLQKPAQLIIKHIVRIASSKKKKKNNQEGKTDSKLNIKVSKSACWTFKII